MSPELFIEKYESALASQTWAMVAPLIAKGATITFSNGNVYKGSDEIKTAFKKNFQIIKNEKFTVNNINWLLKTDSVAAYTFDFQWNGIIKGELAEGSGVGTSVLQCKNGDWMLLTEHLGTSPKK